MTSKFLALVFGFMQRGPSVGRLCGKKLILDGRWTVRFVSIEFVMAVYFLQHMYRCAGLKFSTKTYLQSALLLWSLWNCPSHGTALLSLFPRLMSGSSSFTSGHGHDSPGSRPRSFVFSDLTPTCGLSHHLGGTIITAWERWQEDLGAENQKENQEIVK